MVDTSKPYVPTTPDALRQEFVNNKWIDRLAQCEHERINIVKEYEDGEKEYRKRIISKHMENGIHIAMTITKVFHDGHSTLTIKMLRIGDVPHIVP